MCQQPGMMIFNQTQPSRHAGSDAAADVFLCWPLAAPRRFEFEKPCLTPNLLTSLFQQGDTEEPDNHFDQF